MVNIKTKFEGVLPFLHNTPLYKLQSLPKKHGSVYVKLEKFNLGGSVKSRVGFAMVIDAEMKGILKPYSGQTIIEASGGNTASGLCLCAIPKGYKVVLVIPDNYNKGRIEQLKLLGATVILSDHKTGNDSHFVLARKLAESNPTHYYIDQLSNPANPNIHYSHTGKEIIDCIIPDYFIAGIGSGGTVSGVGRRVKESNSTSKVYGVQPDGCSSLEGKSVPHKIQGISVGVVPPVLDSSVIDDMISVSFEETMECAMEIMEKEGLFLGLSSYANLASAIKIAQKVGSKKNIVTISPDGGEYYLNQYIQYKHSLLNV